mmetsp:Transcript_40248/g.56673  ORF Transcript_40248/g.56673 Transcript_40248/m.56673 type:complete len:107 (+) Transcript_40248:768-1088(+)
MKQPPMGDHVFVERKRGCSQWRNVPFFKIQRNELLFRQHAHLSYFDGMNGNVNTETLVRNLGLLFCSISVCSCVYLSGVHADKWRDNGANAVVINKMVISQQCTIQ